MELAITEPLPVNGALPRDVAIIMDGNGRWAERRGLPRVEGHRRGADSVREIVRSARELGLAALTLYAFSEQNWARPPGEVQALMELLREYLLGERNELLQNGIRLQAIGDLRRLPAFVREPLSVLQQESAGLTGMTLCLALSYGGRQALVDAARQLAQAVADGRMRPADVCMLTFGHALPTCGLPELDLLIRTSGERRLSDFLPWEAAYAELYFTDALWPDFRRHELLEALADYGRRQRRYGLTGQQVRLRATR
jgi:undecaprenyl diphosphate synthase